MGLRVSVCFIGKVSKTRQDTTSDFSVCSESQLSSCTHASGFLLPQMLQLLTSWTVVPQVRANGLIVFVPKYGIEGPIYLTKKDSKSSQGGTASSHQSTATGSAASVASITHLPSNQTSGGGQNQTSSSEQDDQFVLDEDKQMIQSHDGQRSYTVFDKAAVKITVEETFGHRRHLQLSLVDRDELPVSEQMS